MGLSLVGSSVGVVDVGDGVVVDGGAVLVSASVWWCFGCEEAVAAAGVGAIE